MAKLLILDLHSENVDTFLEELKPEQTQTVLGGYITANILTIHDGVNRVENTVEGSNSYNFRDNSFYSIDNSDQVYIWAGVW